MANPSKLLKYVTQFLDPKFNPERRGALQMLAAAPLAGKVKLAQSVAGPQLDPVQFYQGLLKHGLDIAPKYTTNPKLLMEAIRNELPDSDLHHIWKEAQEGSGLGLDDIYNDAYGQAYEDHMSLLGDSSLDDSQFRDQITPEWHKVLDAHARSEELGTDEASDALDEAMHEYLGGLDGREVVAEHGGDDLYSDYLNGVRGENMQNYVDDEAMRLGIEPEELAKRVGLTQFLKQAPQIGTATHGEVEFGDIPEYYYQDPEALRYASLRSMLDHPVLTPSQMLEATGGDITKALGKLGPKDIAWQLKHDLTMPRSEWIGSELKYNDSSLLDTLDMDRMHPEVRDEFINMLHSERLAWEVEKNYHNRVMSKLSEQEPLLQRLEDLPSYVMNRTSPFRVKFDAANRAHKSIPAPLSYSDAMHLAPPSEYSSGGRVNG